MQLHNGNQRIFLLPLWIALLCGWALSGSTVLPAVEDLPTPEELEAERALIQAFQDQGEKKYAANAVAVVKLCDAIRARDENTAKTLVAGDPKLLYGLYYNGSRALVEAARTDQLSLLKYFLIAMDRLPEKDRVIGETLEEIISDRKYEAIHLLLDQGTDVNLHSRWGSTPMLQALEFLPADEVMYFIAHGGNFGATDRNENTAAHCLAKGNADPKLFQMILDAGVDLDAPNADGVTPLMLILTTGFDAASDTPVPYHELTRKRAVGVTFLLDHGASLNKVNKNSATVLHYAARARNLAMVKRCMEAGLNVNALDVTGLTPLDMAVQIDYDSRIEDDPATLAYLLDQGAVPGKRTYLGGSTLLHQVVGDGFYGLPPDMEQYVPAASLDPHRTALYLLLSHHFDPSVRDTNGATPLHQAILSQDPRVIDMLFEFGVDVEAVDRRGATPLHWAGQSGNDEVINALLRHGANPNRRDSYAQTPLHYARTGENGMAVQVLLAHGADPRLRDNNGRTPLEARLWRSDRYPNLSWYADFNSASGGAGVYAGWFTDSGADLNETAALSPTEALLYPAQQNPVNIGLWLAFLIFVPGAAVYLRSRHRRRAERLKASGGEAVPDAVWNDARWKTLATDFERAQVFHAVLVKHRLAMLLPLGMYAFLCGLHWVDPVLGMLTGSREWIQLAVVGGVASLCYGLFYLEKRLLRVAAAYLGFCALGYGTGVFLCEGFMLAVRYELYAVSGLLITGALALLPGLFQFYRMIKMDLALRRLNLPFNPAAPCLPLEAEPLESKPGWDEGKR